MINLRISEVWVTTNPIAPFSCTPRVQEVHTKAEVVHLTPGVLGLGVLFNCHSQEMYCETYVTVSGKTTLLAEIEKVGFLLTMDSINTRLCCGTSSQSIGCFLELDRFDFCQWVAMFFLHPFLVCCWILKAIERKVSR